jgi:hypothetical protein
MMTYVDRVRKKILRANIISYLLLKLRAIKVDTSMFKGSIFNWLDNGGSLCFSCQKHMCIQVQTRPMYDRDYWQIWNKSRNGPLEKPPKKSCTSCKTIRFTCSRIRSLVFRYWFLRGVWILKFPCHVKSSPSHVELYRGKASKWHWCHQQWCKLLCGMLRGYRAGCMTKGFSWN